MLKLTNVNKTFNEGTINEKKALVALNLHIRPGDFITVIGGNGAGKSTMLNVIAGVYGIESGRILLDGEDVSRQPEHVRARRLGRVFQDPMMGTAASMGIEENLAMAYRGKHRGLGWGLQKRNGALR
jgi:putative ABC transport system ATP-binding protein